MFARGGHGALHRGTSRIPTGMSDVDPVPETFSDEISWIFRPNKNEVWVDVFKEDIDKTIELSSEAQAIARIQFTLTND